MTIKVITTKDMVYKPDSHELLVEASQINFLEERRVNVKSHVTGVVSQFRFKERDFDMAEREPRSVTYEPRPGEPGAGELKLVIFND